MDAKLIKVLEHYHLYDGDKAIATTIVGNPMLLPNLSLKNCQEIERGYDLDDCVDYFEKGKLYIQQDGVIILAGENGNNGIIIQDPLETRGVGHYSDEWNPKAFCEFKQKALEILGDKKFTEDDMRKAMDTSINYEIKRDAQSYQEKIDFLKSLQQTKWEVEIVMDICGDKVYAVPEPKLDADGCIILKRK